MKANLTRGNSITENHNPYDGASIEEILKYGFAIVDMHVQQARALRKRYKSGSAQPVVKESGDEVVIHPNGTMILSHDPAIRLLKTDEKDKIFRLKKILHGSTKG